MKRILLLFCLLLASPVWGAPTVGTPNSANTTSTGTGDNTITLSCDAGAGSDRAMFFAMLYDGNTITTVTYAAVSMGTHIHEEIDASTGTLVLRLYKLVAPTTGTNNLVVDFAGGAAVPAIVACVPMSGVDQTTPNDAHVAGDSSGSPMSTSTSSATGDLVLDVIATRASAGGPTLVVDGSQTQRVLHDDELLGGSSRQFGMSTEVGAATVAMGWTGANIGAWVQIVINVNAAAGGGGGGSAVGAVSRRRTQ